MKIFVIDLDPLQIVKRGKPTKAQQAEIIARFKGRCGITGEEFAEGDAIEFDHILALCNGGANHIDNFQPVLSGAHKVKTRFDKKLHARLRHLRLETGQQARRARRKAEGKEGLIRSAPGKMQSRGFDKTKTRKMSGETVERNHGKRIPSVRRHRRGLAQEAGAQR